MNRSLRLDNPPLRLSLLIVLLLALLAGCGGGTLTLSGPVVSSPVISTIPRPLTSAGGTVTVRVQITSSSLLNVSTNPPQIDVKDTSGVSLLGGPKPLTNLSNEPNIWTFQFTAPGNAGAASPKVYQVTIFAQSIGGSTGNTPFFAGSVIVPNR